jgi:hypothetical protein
MVGVKIVVGSTGELDMKKASATQTVVARASGDGEITAYSQAQSAAFRTLCEQLRKLIEKEIPQATSKAWHGAPVWFLEDNPVVGYTATAKSVNLLFWNGQAFDEAALQPVGKYQAAQAVFREAGEIEPTVVRRWLKKARTDVFDSRGFFKKLREGKG